EYDENATVYYVSVNGDDDNDGLTPDTPFESPQGANKFAKEGDVVLFKRGDEWRVRWKANPGVTYSAYGEGEKPVFNGNTYGDAGDPSCWSLVDGTENIWEYKSIIPDVGCLVYNGGQATAEKICLDYRADIGDKQFYVRYSTPFDFNNECFYKNNTFVSKYVHVSKNGVDVGVPARLYLRCDEGNPGDVYDSIEIMYRGNLIGGASGVTFDNLCVKYAGSHGIGMGTVENVTVRNCEVGYIGGSAQFYKDYYIIRYGNGIEVYGGCKNFTIDNCYVYQCYDAGITHQYSNGGDGPLYHETVRFTNNVIEKCIYGIEFFLGRTASGKIDERVMKDVLYKGNILAYSGEGWGHDPSRAAGIKGWDNKYHTENFGVEENVFLLNKTDDWHIGADDESWIPTFRNNTYIHRANETFIRLGRPYNGKYTSIPMPFNERFIEKVFEFIGETGSQCYFVDPKS
ncbi:MAG: right-handed parallel beta-helix repeat-containing protein, partial [Clostridia bacterium]|nr:right-handed parallel beta-helix repeat-containing protein [Clostridia bacterium]